MDLLEVMGRSIFILQAELDGLDGTIPQGKSGLLDRLGIVAMAHSMPLSPLNVLRNLKDRARDTP